MCSCVSSELKKFSRRSKRFIISLSESKISSKTLQKLCDLVAELLLEESNVQPVSTPVTVCGDIHGQVESTTINAII